jgi:hypothetical protein
LVFKKHQDESILEVHQKLKKLNPSSFPQKLKRKGTSQGKRKKMLKRKKTEIKKMIKKLTKKR